jgi:phage/plasmid-like protein (TIGR03299 family)
MSVKTSDVSTCTTIEEAIEKANLGWLVNEAELMNTATGIISTTKKSIYRDDTKEELGITGMGYSILQNTEAWSFFNVICEKYGCKFSKAREFNGGKQVILEAIFPDPVEIRPNDTYQKMYRLSNGFDGIHTTESAFWINRMVCTNGLRANFKDVENTFKMRHTKNTTTRIEKAMAMYGMSIKYFEKFEMVAKELTQKMLDRTMVEKFLDGLCGISDNKKIMEKREIIEKLFTDGTGTGRGTAWDLYNAATEYVDHMSKKTDNVIDDDKTLEYAMVGDGVDFKEKAFDEIMKL